jgi:hypothetical protein
MPALVDDVQRRCELIAAERSREFGIDLRVGFEPGGDVGPCRYLDFADKMLERRRPQMMQVQDEELAPEPRGDFSLGLRLEAIKGYLCVVSFGA